MIRKIKWRSKDHPCMMIICPYKSCSCRCLFCPVISNHRDPAIVTVARFDPVCILERLKNLNSDFTFFLSPVADPFQQLEKEFKNSEKIIDILATCNIPVEFITRGYVPDRVIDVLEKNSRNFCQVAIFTRNENLQKSLAPATAPFDVLLDNLGRMRTKHVNCALRLDPIIPFFNDDFKELEKIIFEAKNVGVWQVVVSSLKIPVATKEIFISNFMSIDHAATNYLKEVYTEKYYSFYSANYEYRHRIFTILKAICSQVNLSISLGREYSIEYKKNGEKSIVDLNRYFKPKLPYFK